jgi:Protein of unknown function (DUF3810)
VARAACIGLAVVLATAPRPPALIERFYGQGLYPLLQRTLTAASNQIPVAVFDLVLLAAAGIAGRWLWRAVADARATRRVAPLGAAALRLATLAAAGYLWFALAWGLNYGRPPIDARLSLAPGAPSEAEVGELARLAVDEANVLYAAARSNPALDADLAPALHAVERRHGRPAPTAVGRPKPSLLGWYFRAAGVDGLTAPLLLETLLNPDLTEAERPFVLAHEWAHLSGYAPEADANFVAWQTTMESTAPRHRYSGWLFLVSETARQLPRDRQRTVLASLADGPRQDLQAIARRAAQRIDVVERIGWRVYDRYLRAQGVDEGVRSYSRVVDLIVRARRGGAGREQPR